jgi:hypothetical protein
MASAYLDPKSYHTYHLGEALIVSAALLLMITAMQDFLDTTRRSNPTVIMSALTRMLIGLFLIYFFFTVLNQR